MLQIKGASENNLKNIDVCIPLNSFSVITGVSGSGKSSLVYDVIFRESQRRFLESFSSYSRQYIGKLEKPDVKAITGLQPALAINQRAMIANPRSTVGTMSGIYDYLRLLYARVGYQYCSDCGTKINESDTNCSECNTKLIRPLSKLFSFNSNYGACPKCNGLGVTEQIDVNKLIADENLTLREGALVPTTPNGYIVYSQVRVDELNKVCQAHDFSVDISWKNLTKEQKKVILYGSSAVKILFGKHSLESRLKWKGITALPREESYYKGMIPIMEDILVRDRNDNILRFASSIKCNECNGTRLRKEARSVTIDMLNICDLSSMQLSDLGNHLINLSKSDYNNDVVEDIIENSVKRIEYLTLLGLDYLTLSRESTTLSAGESQRIKLASQVGSGLQGILYLLDEPSIGLHYHDNQRLLKVLKSLRDNGNTVVVVEHDDQTIRSADYLIDIGPKAGIHGGKVIYQGAPAELFNRKNNYPDSLTAKFLSEEAASLPLRTSRKPTGEIIIIGAEKHNLKKINVEFKLCSLNIVTGVSGAGKSTLVHEILEKSIKNHNKPVNCDRFIISEPIKRVIKIDQSPIGRTPRSNPATYTDLFDRIRELFARQPESIKRAYKKGRFSFNNKGGRCEYCQGAGYIELGMHFLGNVETKCEKCNGKRFNTKTLDIKYRDKNIYEVLELSIEESFSIFEGEIKITRILEHLLNLDVGYLKLGQSSTTLSGGEAQRIKLASELYKSSAGHTLYILDEPSTGLHKADISFLTKSLNNIVDKGNTVVVVEHETDIIKQADHIIDLGPEGGQNGGTVIIQGTPLQVMDCKKSYTGQAIGVNYKSNNESLKPGLAKRNANIQFRGVTTNNLKNIDVEIPLNKITVISGVSGSGKSSLAFDTIYSESRNRFTEGLSSYARRMMSKIKKPELEECSGLTPAIAIGQKGSKSNPRSTVGTITEIYELYRLLFSRIGRDISGVKTKLSASMFSFNNIESACPSCSGIGKITTADPKKFITNPENPLIDGAMDGTILGRFFGNRNGQHINTLLVAGNSRQIDYSVPFNKLTDNAINIAFYGTGIEMHEVNWIFKRGKRHGTHSMSVKWKGLINYLNEDFEIKRKGKRGVAFESIMTDIKCAQCNGSRLIQQTNEVFVAKLNISQLSSLTIDEAIVFFKIITNKLDKNDIRICKLILHQISSKLNRLSLLGIGYLSVNRPVSTLSGGEFQRLRIASQLVSQLCGLTYVLDEPTIGLHPHDTKNLLKSLNDLKDNGNTIVIVEHDPDIIAAADHIIDIGPGSGKYGGKIIAQGNLKEIVSNPKSITGRLMSEINKPKVSRHDITECAITIGQANANNLKNIDLQIPANCMTVITGVSGSGKTSLAFEVIAKSFILSKPVCCNNINFTDFDKVSVIDQKRIGTTPLSTAVTYTNIFDHIRKKFADLDQSMNRNFKKSHFSFNSKEGRCPICKGMGSIKVSMDFLSDVWTVCDSCHGNRFTDDILEIKYYNKNISDVLHMEVSEALSFFGDEINIHNALQVLVDIGLGYVTLGQPTSTFSGGETQRLKLANELINDSGNNCLYIFDEPTTGLHIQDVNSLIILFRKLIDDKNTIIVVEHNTEIIRSSDHIIDLGPEGGTNGGELVYSGNVEGIKDCHNSITGRYL
jgi:excinuclease ABC subunit A